MPQQHAARHGGVQTLDTVGHRDAHGHVAGFDGGIRQALALAADDDADAACTSTVRIPMTDRVESLNAGIAGSILLWHFREESL